MNLLELTNDERNRLQKLNNDKMAIFALKKLFLNVCVNDPASNEAIKKITRAFYELSIIKLDNQRVIKEENLV